MVEKEVSVMSKYILMCGGKYKQFKKPKHLSIINGEVLIERTIRLLKENGVKDIYISTNNPAFDYLDIPKLKHDNNFETDMKHAKGYWLDAFYPTTEPTTYIFGDVWFTDEAIKTIVNYKTNKNVLFGTSIARNKEHQNWGEPFTYIVNDTETFFKGIKEVKKLYDEGKTVRHPIVWELYRYLHGLDINIQRITDDYVDIDDGTIDIDYPEIINEIERR